MPSCDDAGRGPFGSAGADHGPFGTAGADHGPFGSAGADHGPFGTAGADHKPFGTANTQVPALLPVNHRAAVQLRAMWRSSDHDRRDTGRS
ncbi:hypothetical protein [Streptomyces humi]|uniref:hypothetical protein n=1 Tax=Streptomyces humi TaxID=1428620 RepID=UPI0006287C97|nr:hypothetical protein [Streptomyces humi]